MRPQITGYKTPRSLNHRYAHFKIAFIAITPRRFNVTLDEGGTTRMPSLMMFLGWLPGDMGINLNTPGPVFWLEIWHVPHKWISVSPHILAVTRNFVSLLLA